MMCVRDSSTSLARRSWSWLDRVLSILIPSDAPSRGETIPGVSAEVVFVKDVVIVDEWMDDGLMKRMV